MPAVEMGRKESRSQASWPFVKVSQNDPRPLQLRAEQYFVADQLVSLLPALQKTGAQVNVKEVEDRSSYFNIGPQASARLPPARGYVVVAGGLHGETAQQQVPVSATVEAPSFAETIIEAKLCGDKSHMIPLRLSFNAEHLLKRDYIRVNFAQDLNNTGRPDPPVQSPALVNVVRGNSKTIIHLVCWMKLGTSWFQALLVSGRRSYHCIKGVTVIPWIAIDMAMAARTVFATDSIRACGSPC